MKTVFAKVESVPRKWYVIDAQGKVLGKVAAKAASVVRGKNKAVFAPNQEMGDFVVVINADKIVVTGRKREQKMYHRHSGYPGGLKSLSYEKLAARHPTGPLENAIKGMLPKCPLGRKLARNVKIYAGGSHNHGAQNPIPLEL